MISGPVVLFKADTQTRTVHQSAQWGWRAPSRLIRATKAAATAKVARSTRHVTPTAIKGHVQGHARLLDWSGMSAHSIVMYCNLIDLRFGSVQAQRQNALDISTKTSWTPCQARGQASLAVHNRPLHRPSGLGLSMALRLQPPARPILH